MRMRLEESLWPKPRNYKVEGCKEEEEKKLVII